VGCEVLRRGEEGAVEKTLGKEGSVPQPKKEKLAVYCEAFYFSPINLCLERFYASTSRSFSSLLLSGERRVELDA